MRRKEAITTFKQGSKLTHKALETNSFIQPGEISSLVYDEHGFVIGTLDSVFSRWETGWIVHTECNTAFEFENLLTTDGKSVTGPLEPLTFASEMAKKHGFKVHGLCRVVNPSSSSKAFDHLVVVTRYKSSSGYILLCDMVFKTLVIGRALSSDKKATLSPEYPLLCTETAQADHRYALESNDIYDLPLMLVDTVSLQRLFLQADEGNYLTPIKEK